VFGLPLTPEEAVDRIIKEVAESGDQAVLDYTRRIDGVELASVVLPREDVDTAALGVEGPLVTALEHAAERVRSFHRAAMPRSWFDEATGLGQQFTPVQRVGIYVPGGTAAYPSTVLHTVVPARVAGVRTVIMATPPGPGGVIPAAVLAAARLTGVDVVVRAGGAQAIAAMALGTASVPRVDKVFGPGNIFVTIAKRKLFGQVGIDGLHGPTETMIVADDSADVSLCAADLLAQAEHDVLATPVLATTSHRVFDALPAEIERQLATLERAPIARESLGSRSVLILVNTVEEGIELANQFGPEHLCLLVQEPRRYAGLVRNAGGLFLGEASPEVLGDYVAGPSHTMPTGGTARFTSALGVHDFMKITSVVGLAKDASEALYATASLIARAEGLTGHARAAEARLQKHTRLERAEDGGSAGAALQG
jgi:histidinol dehydrogenase